MKYGNIKLESAIIFNKAVEDETFFSKLVKKTAGEMSFSQVNRVFNRYIQEKLLEVQDTKGRRKMVKPTNKFYVFKEKCKELNEYDIIL